MSIEDNLSHLRKICFSSSQGSWWGSYNKPTGGLAVAAAAAILSARGLSCETCGLAAGLTPTFQKPPLFLIRKKSTHLCPYQESPVRSIWVWKKLFLEWVEKEAKYLLLIYSYLQGSTFTHLTTFKNLSWTRGLYFEHLPLKLFKAYSCLKPCM